MIIYHPELFLDKNEVCLSTRVEFSHLVDLVPPTLWYRLPDFYADFVTVRSDAFISALLLLGMVLHEDIEVHGKVSPHLAYGLEECQHVFHAWFPRLFHKVTIRYHELTPVEVSEAGTKIVSSFSGGIDSTYTLMHHLPPMQTIPEYRITHAIFLQGFDIPLSHIEYYQHVFRIFSSSLEKLGVAVIPCRTNVRSFLADRMPWNYAHGGALISPALILTRLIKKYLVASSWTLKNVVPWGSSALTDHLFSTETTEIVHSGLPYGRMYKTDIVSNWEPARYYLRVCTSTKLDSRQLNCGTCEKCRRSMIMLQATGNLKKFSTLMRHITLFDYFCWIPGYITHVPQIARYLRMHKKFLSITLLFVPFITGWGRYVCNKLMPTGLRVRLKKWLYPIQKDAFGYHNELDSQKQ